MEKGLGYPSVQPCEVKYREEGSGWFPNGVCLQSASEPQEEAERWYITRAFALQAAAQGSNPGTLSDALSLTRSDE